MNADISVLQERSGRQEAFWGWVDGMVQQMATSLVERMLELQMRAHVGAGWNQRSPSRRGYRNGHYRRRLMTPQGVLEVRIPRCRAGGWDASMVFERYQRRIVDVDRILRHAFLLGTSTRATAELAEQVFGGGVSHQTISRLMVWLDGELAGWRTQPIAPIYKVVYVDGMHVDVVGGDRTVMLVSGQREDAALEVLGFCVSTGEQSVELLADLRRRGLEEVELFVSDESGAIRSALEQVYPEVAWQHCSFHRLSALRDDIGPADFRDAMLAEAACIFRCPSRAAAIDAALAWTGRWKASAPWAVQHFMTDLTDSLRFYSLPEHWWRSIRTNNPLEGLIRTLRIRLRPMGCFHDDAAIQRAIFGQLLRWHKIKLTHNT